MNLASQARFNGRSGMMFDCYRRLSASRNWAFGLRHRLEPARSLLSEYGYSLRNIVAILDPQSVSRRAPAAVGEKSSRKPRQLKVYKNPHTGERVETKGGNHKTLKEWKSEYGADEVESWLA